MMPREDDGVSGQSLIGRTEARNLPVIEEGDAPPEVARLYGRFRESFGRPEVPAILKCFATHPPLLEHMLGLAQTMLFVEGALDRRQKELISTFVSSRNECAYCADSHGASLRTQGGTPAQLAAGLACDANSTALSKAEGALLRFVRKVTDESALIAPGDVEELRACGWTDLQIAETIHMGALFACFNRVVNAFGLPSQGMLGEVSVPSSAGNVTGVPAGGGQ